MKKQLSFAYTIIVLNFILSCSKSEPGTSASNEYYVRFKMNGVQVEYKANAEATFNKPSGSDHITTLGGTREPFEAKKNNMTIGLTTNGANATNLTYTNYATLAAGTAKAKLLQLAFFDDSGKFFMSWSDDFVSLLLQGSPINCRLVLTEATSTFIKGNFSGTLYTQDYTSNTNITDGEFFLKVR